MYRLDREKKLLQAKLAQQQQESEMEEWKDSVLASREIVSCPWFLFNTYQAIL